MQQELLRVTEAAAVLGIGRTKCYELVASGRLPVVRIDGAVRVPRAALMAWIAENTSETWALLHSGTIQARRRFAEPD